MDARNESSLRTALRHVSPKEAAEQEERREGEQEGEIARKTAMTRRVRSAKKTALLASLFREDERRLEDEKLRCCELYRLRRGNLTHVSAQLHRLRRGDAAIDEKLASAIPDPAVRDALERFSSARLSRLRLVWKLAAEGALHSWCTLAVVEETGGSFFLPRQLTLEDRVLGASGRRHIDSGSLEDGDCVGYILPVVSSRNKVASARVHGDNDSSGTTSSSSSSYSRWPRRRRRPRPQRQRQGPLPYTFVVDEAKPYRIPRDMSLTDEAATSQRRRRLTSSTLQFYVPAVLKASPLLYLTGLEEERVADCSVGRDGDSAGEGDGDVILQRITTALVASRQVVLFFGDENRRSVHSLSKIEKYAALFEEYFRGEVVPVAMEKFQMTFACRDYTNLLGEALSIGLPVVTRWNGRRRSNGDDDEEEVECLLTRANRDLVNVAFARCPLLEWRRRQRHDSDGVTPCRGREEDSDGGGDNDTKRQDKCFLRHCNDFLRLYRNGQLKWARELVSRRTYSTLNGNECRGGIAGAGSPCTSSNDTTNYGNRRRSRDYEGFLLVPWRNQTFLQRSVAEKMMHCWRLLHFDLFADFLLLFLHDSPEFHEKVSVMGGRRGEEGDIWSELLSKPCSVRDPVKYVADRLLESVWKVQQA